MEDEDFGYCESCGVEIGIRRTEARPTADLCIDCKTLAEIRENRWRVNPVRFYPIYDRREFSRLILYCPQHD